MTGVALIFVSSVLFIHLGLGEAVMSFLGYEFVLLRCSKCLSFWCVFGYSFLFTDIKGEMCLAVAFGASYLSLWLMLLLDKLAELYEKFR